MHKHKIRAVHDDDLKEFLDSISLLGPIRKGDINCYICERVITLENLQAVIPINNTIVAVCSDSECLKKIEQDNIL